MHADLLRSIEREQRMRRSIERHKDRAIRATHPFADLLQKLATHGAIVQVGGEDPADAMHFSATAPNKH
jgi:hypothetical protein